MGGFESMVTGGFGGFFRHDADGFRFQVLTCGFGLFLIRRDTLIFCQQVGHVVAVARWAHPENQLYVSEVIILL